MLTIDFPKKSCQTKTQGCIPGRKKTFWKCSSMETNTHCLCWMAVSACILSQSQFSCTSCWVHFQPVLTLILTGDSAGGQVPGDSKPKEGGTKGKGDILKGDVAQRRGSCYQNWGHRSSKVLFKEGLTLKGRTQFGCLKSSRACVWEDSGCHALPVDLVIWLLWCMAGQAKVSLSFWPLRLTHWLVRDVNLSRERKMFFQSRFYEWFENKLW